MTRLPTPGGDAGNWGTILNEYLGTVHNTDGSLKTGVVAGSHLADGSITTDKLADASITTTKLASSIQTTLSSVVTTSSLGVAGGIASLDSSGKVPASQLPQASGGTTPEASATVSGTIRLSGDLGGTASSPTVTKLSGVSLSGTPSAGQALVATSSTVAGWQSISTGGSTNPNAGTVWNTASDPATGATASSVKDGDMWVDTSHATLVSLKNRINGQWVEVSSATKPAIQTSDLVTGLTVTNPTSTGLTLSWTAPANPNGTVDGYHVYNNGTKLTTTPLTVTTYNVTLPAETAYSLTVAVVVAGVEKTPSPATTGTTPAGNNTTSDLVTGLSVSNLAQTSLTLSWTAPTNPSGTVAGYNVYVGSSSTPANGSTPIPASTLTYQVTGLTANTDYTLNVKTLVGTTESQAVSASGKTTVVATNHHIFTESKTYKIMTIGDSTTAGWDGSTGGASPGYRGPLWTLLNTAGISTESVGPNSDTANGVPIVDANHDKHAGNSGWPLRDMRDNVSDWMNQSGQMPDIALIMGGNNSMTHNPQATPQETADELRGLITNIYSQNNSAIIFASTDTPNAPAASANLQAYVSLVPGVVAEFRSTGHKIYFVDTFSLVPQTYEALPDGGHPTQYWYGKIAENWFNEIMTADEGNDYP